MLTVMPSLPGVTLTCSLLDENWVAALGELGSTKNFGAMPPTCAHALAVNNNAIERTRDDDAKIP